MALMVSTALAGCRSGGTASPQVVPLVQTHQASSHVERLGKPLDKIKHIVIIVQQDRSFNDLFTRFPGAKTMRYGYDSKNQRIVLKPVGLQTTWDLEHDAKGFLLACNGVGSIPGTDCRMNGFNLEYWTCGRPGEPRCPIRYPPYAYVPYAETAPYLSIAKQYVLADEMYPSNFDDSNFVSLQYIIAAQSGHTTGDPLPGWGCPGGPFSRIWTIDAQRRPAKWIRDCFNYKTLGDELDAAGLPWAYYASPVRSYGGGRPCGTLSDARGYGDFGLPSAYAAIRHICYGPDWDKDIFSPQKRFFSDINRGELRAVTWITPTYVNSDQAGVDSSSGPSWAASVVNAIGESKFWNSSAIFIFWTGYGGWYDPEPPAYVDYDGLGIRVPMLIVSPYAKDGHVSHVHYEHGSILKFIEDRFGLARLAASDKRANSPEQDCFDFSAPPRKFVPIKPAYP